MPKPDIVTIIKSSGKGEWIVAKSYSTGAERQTDSTNGSRIWSRGGPQQFFPRFCRRSEAESGEQSEPILAGVQGPP